MLTVKESGGGSITEYVVRYKGGDGDGGRSGLWWTSVVTMVLAAAAAAGPASAISGMGIKAGSTVQLQGYGAGDPTEPSPPAPLLVLLVPAAVVIPTLVLMAYWSRQQTVEESVLCIRGLGIQLRSKKRSGEERYTFYEKEKIQNVYINEGFFRFEPRYYIAFGVEGSDKLVLAFPELLPGLETNVAVYHGCRAMLGGDGRDEGVGRGGSGGV